MTSTSEQQAVPVAQEVKDDRLWCMHVTGMDDVHPAPDRETAQLWAAQFTIDQQRRHPSPHPYDPVMNFTVSEWPWSAYSHAESLAKSIAANTWPVDPLAALSTPSEQFAKSSPDAELLEVARYSGFQSAVTAIRSWASGFSEGARRRLDAIASDLERNRPEILGSFNAVGTREVEQEEPAHLQTTDERAALSPDAELREDQDHG